ncbi:MAG: TetR/AcrR family transcriptional regulator [Gammaproteobacteria bacterium]
MKPKQRRNRQATEAAILDAFERVIVRDGLGAANPTSVMQEAGFSKPLLYDYFGNMAGLAKAWTENHEIWPDHAYPDADGDAQEFSDYLKDFLIATANGLRDNPVTLELLAAELGPKNEFQPALEESRRRWLQQNMRGMLSHEEIQEPENWNLLFVCYSAIVYLALRSRRDAPHAGLQLNTDAGWEEALQHIEQLVDEMALLARLKRIMRTGQRTTLARMLDVLEEHAETSDRVDTASLLPNAAPRDS